jgi:hypothetical protein
MRANSSTSTIRASVSGPGDDDALHLLNVGEVAKEVAKLRIALQRQRVLPFGTVERDRADPVLDVPLEVAWLNSIERNARKHLG